MERITIKIWRDTKARLDDSRRKLSLSLSDPQIVAGAVEAFRQLSTARQIQCIQKSTPKQESK